MCAAGPVNSIWWASTATCWPSSKYGSGAAWISAARSASVDLAQAAQNHPRHALLLAAPAAVAAPSRCASMCSASKDCRTARTASPGSRTRFALLDHLQLRALGLRRAVLAGGRRRRAARRWDRDPHRPRGKSCPGRSRARKCPGSPAPAPARRSPRRAKRASKLTKSLPSFSIWVAEKLTLRTILPSLTYCRGTVTPSAAASTTMCGVSPLSEIHSCRARSR